MKLIVGLGNPGQKYEKTRHNVGFMVVEAMASQHRIAFSEKGDSYFLGSGKLDQEAFLIAKPRTFMNQSGNAVKQILNKADLDPSQMIVVHDDLDLALGRIQIKLNGGHGGHKGILSIISVLQTNEFYRLRVGVGRPPEGLDPAEYVLQPFLGEAERLILDGVIRRSTEALRCMIVEGSHKAMDRYNQSIFHDQ